jgi:hypothetical protein
MKTSITLCAAIIVSGALAGCGDGASDSTTTSSAGSASLTASQNGDASLAPSQAAINDVRANAPRLALNAVSASPSAQHDSDPRSSLATNAQIDPPSPPTAMSPGVIASVDPMPLVSRPANYSVFAARSADDPEVQVQPVVHYAPEASDSP